MEEKKTRAQDKWDAKAGVVSKSYKVEKETAEQFKEVCKKMGVGQGPILTKFMKEFIEQNQ